MNYNKPTSESRGRNTRAGRNPRKSPDTLAQLNQLGSSLRSIGLGGLRGILEKLFEWMPFLFPLAFVAFLVWGLFAAIDSALNMPEVHESWTTKECVKVVNADGSEGSCDNLPDKYKHVWVH